MARCTGYSHAKQWTSINILHHKWKLTQDGSQIGQGKNRKHLSNKGFVAEKEKEFSKVHNEKTNHPIFLMVKRFEHFTKEDIQVA